MNRETIRTGLDALGITQADLARAAGISEAGLSRQLSGDLRLSEHVQNQAEELIARRVILVTIRIRDWVKARWPAALQSSRQHAPATAVGDIDRLCEHITARLDCDLDQVRDMFACLDPRLGDVASQAHTVAMEESEHWRKIAETANSWRDEQP